VHTLFFGRAGKVGKKMTREFLRGEEERAALKVLAKLVRNGGLYRVQYETLAALLDPDQSFPSRRLAFRSRQQRGGRKESGFGLEIAWDLGEAKRNGLKYEIAVAEAAKKYGVSERTVTRAWRKYKDAF
jgi:hypothetical protein